MQSRKAVYRIVFAHIWDILHEYLNFQDGHYEYLKFQDGHHEYLNENEINEAVHHRLATPPHYHNTNVNNGMVRHGSDSDYPQTQQQRPRLPPGDYSPYQSRPLPERPDNPLTGENIIQVIIHRSLYFKTTHWTMQLWSYIAGGLKMRGSIAHKIQLWDKNR